MQRRNIQRFLVDANLFISAIKKWARSTDLFFELIHSVVIIDNPSEVYVSDCKQYFPRNETADAVHAATCLQYNAVLISNDKHFDKIREMKIIEVWKISEAIEKFCR